MAKDDDSLTSYLLKYADKAAKSVSQAYDKTMGMPEEIAQQTYDYVIAQGGTEEQARGIAGRLASKAGRTTGAIDFMIPQSASDVAFMAAGPLGPATKAGKAALAAGSSLMVMDPAEAEAGPLTKMRKGLENFMEGSVLREKDGDPTRLYHGSKSDIKYFDTNHPDRKDTGWMGRGVYAFDSPAGANLYAMTKRGPVGENITPLYGRLTNPYEFTMAEKKAMSTMGQDKIDDFTNELVRKGHDGAILKYPDGTREVVVYDPKMVKSAIGNTGDYDMTTDLLTKRAGGAVQGYAVGGDVTDEGLEKLFGDYFGRGSDPGGLKYWKDTAAQNNLSLSDIGRQFAGSDEGREQYAKLQQSIGGQNATDATGAAPWKTWWGYTPTKKDYDMMLRAGLGEYGLTDDPNQVLGIYEAIGNRAAANNFIEKNAYAYDKTRPGGRFAKTLADQITEDEVEGAYATGRINSLLNSKDPAKMAIVQQARDQLLNYFTLGQNKVLGSQTDWRGFDPVTGVPSTGEAWRDYKGDAGRVVPGSEELRMYNTFYNPKYRPDLQVKLANLQGQKNAIWGAPLPVSRPSDTVLAQVQIFTDEDGKKSIFKNGVQTYIDDQEAAVIQAANEAGDQTLTEEVNPFDTDQTVGGVQTANVEQNVGGQNNNNTIGDDYTFIPNVTPGADTGLGFSTYDPNSFKVYRNDSIDQNTIDQNNLTNNVRNWQQDFNNVVGGQFNMSNPGLVGGYNSSNIGGFDYSGLNNSIGNVGATSGFGLNTGWDFGGGWGFAEGGPVDLRKMLEGEVAQAEAAPPELAPADVEMAPLEAIKAASTPVNPRAGTGIGGALSRIGQGIADSAIVRGAGEIPGTVANYFSGVTAGPDPSQRLGQDLGKLGSMVYEGVKADPVGAVLDVLPVVGEIRSGMDASKYSDAAVEAEIAGDEPRASMFRQLAAMSTAGAAPILGVGARLAKRGAKAGVEAAEDTVKLFHGTTEEGYKGITSSNKIEGPVYLTPRSDVAKDYSLQNSSDPYVVEVNVPKNKLMIDFDLPGGRLLDVESANSYSGNTGWTIDDYLSRGYSVGVNDGVPLAKRGAKAGTEGAEAFVREGAEGAAREGVEGVEAAAKAAEPMSEYQPIMQAFTETPEPAALRDSVVSKIAQSIDESAGDTAKLPTVSGLGPQYIVDSGVEDVVKKNSFLLASTKNRNADKQLNGVASLLDEFPDMAMDPEQWARGFAKATGERNVVAPPYRFMKAIADGDYTELLRGLTPGQISDADAGFAAGKDFLKAYHAGQMGVEDTGKMFMWGIMSRGVNPFTHEGLFLDAFNGIEPWIKMAAEGKFTKEVAEGAYKEWAATTAPKGSGQPGSGAMHNLNAFGKDFLLKMSQPDKAGVTPLQKLHDLMADPNKSGRDIRREFARVGEGVGIDNKVVSFILLATGRDDVMVIDRIQLKNLWDDGRYADTNIWDGISVPTVTLKDDTVKRFPPTDEGRAAAKDFAAANPGSKGGTAVVTGSSLAEATYGAKGILIYEAIEDALMKNVQKIYADLGRPDAASPGRFHWETWVARSNQEASHGTLPAILKKVQGSNNPLADVYSKQGDYQSYAYGAKYMRDAEGNPMFSIPLSSGSEIMMTPQQYQSALAQMRKPKYGVVPKNFKVTETEGMPWYEREGVNRSKLDDILRAAAGQEGAIRKALGGPISYGSGDRAGGRGAANVEAPVRKAQGGVVRYSEGGEVDFKKMFEGDSQAMQERARELAREAYSKGYSSLGKEKAKEWENLARKYNLPLNVGPFDNYEDQYSNALSGWQRNVSPKQRVQSYDEGGLAKADLAAEELTNLQKILAGSNPAANVAPFQLDLGGGSQARGRVVQAGPYIDIGGGITLPLRDVMLMLDASYGKVPGTDMKPNISVRGGLRIPFAEGGAVTPYNADEIAALANQIYEGTNG
jgi:hypothetical protein